MAVAICIPKGVLDIGNIVSVVPNLPDIASDISRTTGNGTDNDLLDNTITSQHDVDVVNDTRLIGTEDSNRGHPLDQRFYHHPLRI